MYDMCAVSPMADSITVRDVPHRYNSMVLYCSMVNSNCILNRMEGDGGGRPSTGGAFLQLSLTSATVPRLLVRDRHGSGRATRERAGIRLRPSAPVRHPALLPGVEASICPCVRVSFADPLYYPATGPVPGSVSRRSPPSSAEPRSPSDS